MPDTDRGPEQRPEAIAEEHLRDARERLREAAATLRRMLDGQRPPSDVLDQTATDGERSA